MKRLLLPFLLCLGFSLVAQSPELISLSTDDRLFSGTIGGEYPITIYLQSESYSPNHGAIHSVSGWYRYDRVGTPIPLAGLKGQQLTLFTSDDSQFLENLINFEVKTADGTLQLDAHIFEMEDRIEEITDYGERFQLDVVDNRIRGTWKKGDKELEVDLWGNSLWFEQEKQYLRLPNGRYFDLDNVEAGLISYELEAHANGGRNVLLSYAYPANLNYNGRCGGAENRGMVSLVFDADFRLQGILKATFDACYQDIYIDDERNISDSVTDFTIRNFNEGTSTTYRVDWSKASMVQQ